MTAVLSPSPAAVAAAAIPYTSCLDMGSPPVRIRSGLAKDAIALTSLRHSAVESSPYDPSTEILFLFGEGSSQVMGFLDSTSPGARIAPREKPTSTMASRATRRG